MQFFGLIQGSYVLISCPLSRGNCQSLVGWIQGHACWENITWNDFKVEFRKAHIPSGIMAIKKREFRALKQGSSAVKEYMQKFSVLSRYAPEDDVSTDAAKRERFMEGLNQTL